jgi:hypothetical protein
MKATPKSCSCQHCTRGKHTKAGHVEMKRDERKFRHAAKIALKKGAEVFSPAPKGNFYD